MSINISYHLNKSKRYADAKELAIIGRITYSFLTNTGIERRQFKFATDKTCPVDKFREGRASSKVVDAFKINSRLDDFEKKAIKLYEQFEESKNFPQPKLFKQRLFAESLSAIEERNFINDFEDYIKDKGSPKLPIVKNLTQTLKRIKGMSAKTKYPLDYASINLEFYNKFRRYCTDYVKTDGTIGLAANTVGVHIKLLKTFLNYARGNGWNKYEMYKLKAFAITSSESFPISLTEDEITRIAELDLSHRIKDIDGIARLELSRDYFLLACETGLRFCDFPKLMKKKQIKEVSNGYNLEIEKTQKTKEPVIIPLSKLAMDVFKKYQFEIVKPPAYKNLLENLKVI